MTGAAIASAVVGVGGLVQGKKGADDAEDYANQAVGSAEEMNRYLKQLGDQGVEQAQGMMDNWESTFGGVQDNMSEYYNNLDATKFATQGKEKFGQAMDKQMTQFNDSMAASGLQSAGMKQQASKEAAFKTAEGNAAIDIGSEEKVANMQQGFLNYGEGSANRVNNTMNSAMTRQGNFATTGSTNLQDAYAGKASTAAQSSAGFMGAGGSAMGSAVGLGINADPKTDPLLKAFS